MSNSINCMLCNISSPAEIIASSVRDDTSGRFKIYRCLTCGHVQLFPHPPTEETREFYVTDSQTLNIMGEVDFSLWGGKTTADIARRINWLSYILPLVGEKNVLDVGCGYGFFVDRMARAGYQATGIDISRERLTLATQSHLQGTFILGDISEPFINDYRNTFHAVTLFHVLEHVHKPVTFLQQCIELISPGGFLLIEVPNLGDELLNYEAHYRQFYWQQAHLSYFDAARLELTLRKAGFKDFAIRGVQRYGLRNLIHWLDEGKPQLTSPTFHAKEPALAQVEQVYRFERERAFASDTLITEVRICR